jgi:hypothetical protein
VIDRKRTARIAPLADEAEPVEKDGGSVAAVTGFCRFAMAVFWQIPDAGTE